MCELSSSRDLPVGNFMVTPSRSTPEPRRKPGGMSWDDMIDELLDSETEGIAIALETEGGHLDGHLEAHRFASRDDIRDIVRQALEDHGIDPDALHD